MVRIASLIPLGFWLLVVGSSLATGTNQGSPISLARRGVLTKADGVFDSETTFAHLSRILRCVLSH